MNTKLIILISLFLAACQPVQVVTTATPTGTPRRKPIQMEIPSLGITFPLQEINPYDSLPYESGPAFWFRNGVVFDVGSHCGETPGDDFQKIQAGDILVATYDDESKRQLVAYEIIIITYENMSNPYAGDWIDQNDIHYTPQEFAEYIAVRKDQYMLHSSRCTTEFSIGQKIIMAK